MTLIVKTVIIKYLVYLIKVMKNYLCNYLIILISIYYYFISFLLLYLSFNTHSYYFFDFISYLIYFLNFKFLHLSLHWPPQLPNLLCFTEYLSTLIMHNDDNYILHIFHSSFHCNILFHYNHFIFKSFLDSFILLHLMPFSFLKFNGSISNYGWCQMILLRSLLPVNL